MITSAQNRKVKDIRRWRRRKGEMAILEGPHLVQEALARGLDFVILLATESFATSEEGAFLAGRRDLELIHEDLLDRITDSDSPRGVLAVGSLPHHDLAALPKVSGGTYLYLDGIQNPGNLGALARVAEAAGVTALVCGHGTAHPNHPRALRASAGSLLRLPVAVEAKPEDLSNHLASLEAQWWILDASAPNSFWVEPFPETLVLALGAEGPGVSDDLRRLTHRPVSIPLAAPVESLNVTVAAALALFERRRRLGSTRGS